MAQPERAAERRPTPAGEEEERRLLARVSHKDRAAFELLYHRYHARLFNYLLKVTRQPEQVEELLNDVMLVVWRKAATFQLDARPSTWIFGIAYRKALKALSRRGRLVEGPWELSEESQGQLAAAPESEPEFRLARRELASTLNEAMAALSPEQRAVLELTYTYGYSCREIAELVGCPQNTVKTRMFHARRRLRAALPELEGAV